jgi:CheY-like chemotaxis protein
MSKSKILLIDDEEDFVLLMTKKLESEGYEVISASNGEEGIARAKADKPDLVICDLKMPVSAGKDKDIAQYLKE